MADQEKILEYGRRQGRFIDALKHHPAYQGWSDSEIVKNVNDVVTSGKPDRVAKFIQGVATLPDYEGWQPREVLNNVSEIFTKPTSTEVPNKEKVTQAVESAPQRESFPSFALRKLIQEPAGQMEHGLGKLQEAGAALGQTTPERFPADLMRAASATVNVAAAPFSVLNPFIEGAGQAIETLPGGEYLNPSRHLENISKLGGMAGEEVARLLGANQPTLEASEEFGESIGGLAPFIIGGLGAQGYKAFRSTPMELAQAEMRNARPLGWETGEYYTNKVAQRKLFETPQILETPQREIVPSVLFDESGKPIPRTDVREARAGTTPADIGTGRFGFVGTPTPEKAPPGKIIIPGGLTSGELVKATDVKAATPKVAPTVTKPADIAASQESERIKLTKSGYSPSQNVFNTPGLIRNKTFAWRSMGESEFQQLVSGEKEYLGEKAATKGNFLAGIPESAGQYGGKGKILVEFGGVNIGGEEGLTVGSKATRENVTNVWVYDIKTNTWKESPELLSNFVAKAQTGKAEAPPTVTKSLDQSLIEDPLDKHPAPVKDAIQQKAADLQAEALGWEVVKIPGGVVRVTEEGGSKRGTVIGNIAGNAISTFPTWFNRLGVSKTKVIEALEKIKQDEGKDKGRVVEELKQIIFDEAKEGGLRPEGELPPDQHFSDMIDAYKAGTLDEYLKQTQLPTEKPATSIEASKPGEQGTLLTEQAKYPRANEGIRSSENIGTANAPLFETPKPPEPELPLPKAPDLEQQPTVDKSRARIEQLKAEAITEVIQDKLKSLGMSEYVAGEGAKLLKRAGKDPAKRRAAAEYTASLHYKETNPEGYQKMRNEVATKIGLHKDAAIDAVKMAADEIETALGSTPTATMGAAARLELRDPTGSFAEALPAEQFPNPGAIRGAVEQIPESEIQKQRRGERSHDVTIEAAKRQGEILDQALSGQLKPGTYSIAEAQYALGAEMAKRFTGRTVDTITPQDANLIKSWLGLRAEAGRGVESFKIPVDPEVADFIRKIDPNVKLPIDVPPSIMDKIVELARNMKLIFSAASRGVIGNTVMQAIKFPTLLADVSIKNFMDAITGRPISRVYREAVADAMGSLSGIKEGARTAWHLLQENQEAVMENAFYQQDIQRQGAIGGKLGLYVRFPQRLHGAIDALYRVPTAKGLIGREAMRQAFREGKKGLGLIDRANELMKSPTPEMVSMASTDARYYTFQQDVGGMLGAIGRVRFSHPAAQLIVPFYNTPVNLMKNMLDYTPIAFIKPTIAKAIKELIIDKKYNENADFVSQALSRSLIGTQFITFTGNIIFNMMDGKISGRGPTSREEKDQLERATGWKPYSVKLGNNWYSYVGFEPLSGWLSMLSDFHEGYKDEGWGKGLYDSAVNLIKNFAENPFMTGAKSTIETLQDPGGDVTVKFLTGLAVGSIVPVFVQQSRYILDPTLRRPQGFEQIVKSKIPGLTTDIPPQRNVMGELRRIDRPGLGLIGMRVSSAKNDPDEIETQRIGLVTGWPSDMYAGIKLTPEQHDKLIEVAGKSLYLARHALMASPAYKILPDGIKVDAIKRLQDEIRDLQRQTLFQQEKLQGITKKIEPRITGGAIPPEESEKMMKAIRKQFSIPEPVQ